MKKRVLAGLPAVAFYAFIRSLQAYELVLNDNTTLVLSTDSELFKYLKNKKNNFINIKNLQDARKNNRKFG